jgi:hypothetical protein
MRLPTALVVFALVAPLVGCGGGSNETTSSRTVDAGSSTQQVQAAWEAKPDCMHPQGASRWGCSVGPYRCQGVVTDRGWSVSCARPGRSISFTVPPRK